MPQRYGLTPLRWLAVPVALVLLGALLPFSPTQTSSQALVPFDAPVRSGQRVRETPRSAGDPCLSWDQRDPVGPWWPPNELGQVPILVYHQVEDHEDRWTRHYENFRGDLERLYRKGFRAISLHDYLEGRIHLPAGTAPVIFTFDDSTAGHFRLLDTGEIDPRCAVGILVDFHRENPDFGLEATFYINFPYPFRNADNWRVKLQMLVDLGMDIGNHTWTHADLSKVSPEEARRQLAKLVGAVEEVVPGYQVDTLALPYGLFSPDISYLLEGEWEGISYHNRAILLAGGNPALSPLDSRYDPLRIARIQATGPQLDRWISYFQSNPGLLYVSDGCRRTITIPEEAASRLNPEVQGEREVILYSP